MKKNQEFGSESMRDAFHRQMKNLGFTNSLMLNSKALAGDTAAIDAELRRGILDKALGEYIMYSFSFNKSTEHAISHSQLLKILRLEQFFKILILWVFTEDLE